MRVSLYPCDSKQLTSDGRWLKLSGDVTASVDLQLHQRDEEDYPQDLLVCRIDIADSLGAVWAANSFITAETLIRHMFDLSRNRSMNLLLSADVPKPFTEALANNLLVTGLRSTQDDDFYRELLFKDGASFSVITVPFRQATFVFDIAALFLNNHWVDEFIVRVATSNDRGVWLFDADGNSVPSFVFGLSPEHLFKNTAVFVDGHWRSGKLSAPLVFSPADRTSKPQPRVTIEPRNLS